MEHAGRLLFDADGKSKFVKRAVLRLHKRGFSSHALRQGIIFYVFYWVAIHVRPLPDKR